MRTIKIEYIVHYKSLYDLSAYPPYIILSYFDTTTTKLSK